MAKKKSKAPKGVPTKKVQTTVAQWGPWLGPVLLLLLTFVMFGDVLLDSSIVLSRSGADLFREFIALREFGFRQLRIGNLPLWNPYLFSGMPYLGNFQSAILYPPNLLHLVLPVASALNVLIALHIFLSGLFMHFWALRRGLHQLSATMSGALLMFCGALFLHIYAGHLSNLFSMVWAPLLFLAIDGLFESREPKWCLLGMFALSMQILAGHPQYVFYTCVAAGIYWCFRITKARGRLTITAGFATIFIGAALLAAVQLLPGIDASSQSVRGQGVSFGFAAMFSFPPENLLTLIVPNFFGNINNTPYWGRCFLWEMSLFMGVTGLVLAIFGSIRGDKELRLFALPMALVLLLLAFGSHTPLFKVLYNYFPGFDRFRGNSKFIFHATLFLAMLAGVGMNTLQKAHYKHLRLMPYVVGGALAALVAGLVLISSAGDSPAQWWLRVLHAVSATGESYLLPLAHSSAKFAAQAATNAAWGMFISAGTLALLAGLIWALKHGRWAVYGISVLAIVEVFVFARSSRVTFNLCEATMPPIQQFFTEHPGDYRVLNMISPNLAMLTEKGDLWGYDPGVPARYAQFIAFTQNEDPDHATQYLEFKGPNSLYRMLRLKYVLIPEQQRMRVIEMQDVLDRLRLINDYEILNGRGQIFKAMSEHFDQAQKVILEAQPQPAPQLRSSTAGGKVRIVNSSTDFLEIQGDLLSPAILLITDGYSKDWQVKSLTGSIQPHYEVMPANYVLMAVPLSAGYHHFRLEYAPWAFEIGKWISLASLTVFLGVAGQLMWRKKTLRSSRKPIKET
ncbi:MAG: YfhO family protein [Desulfobacterales bacterium]|nr:YfhO family protein [Desulfobacterales bacterium]